MARYIETDTASNVNISSATAIGTYTADGDRLIIVDVCIDAVTGNGDYVMYITKKIGGAGSAYVILPKTVMTAANGETAISYQSSLIAVRSGDILTVYVDGLAGDTTTPDYTTRWFESDALVTLAATQGAITWGQQKIIANVANQGALDILNSNTSGYGQQNRGYQGLRNYSDVANGAGQANIASQTGGRGMQNYTSGANGISQQNSAVGDSGIAIQAYASGASSIGQQVVGVAASISGTLSNVTNLTNLPSIPADWITANGIKSDAVTKIQNGLATPTNITQASGITLADNAITAAKFDESTAFPLKSADAGATAVARVGADGDTLETLSDQMDGVQADTGDILADTRADGVVVGSIKADAITASSLKLDAVDEIADGVWDEAIAGHVAAGTFGAKNQKVVPSEILSDYKADVSSLATSLALTGVENKIDTVDGIVDDIKAKTDNLPADPASQSAVESAIDGIPEGITTDDILNSIIEGAVTLRDSLKLANAMNAGKVSGGKTTSIVFRDLADTLDRIIMTVDESGNRSAVVKDLG